ncbi:hypothetical protein KP509_05G015000 [Ceratopteris richardii]|uniref:Cyclin n=1 Tax=Ceratopteris richardii TaxID=49495 RepID=A0A8T2UW73_CERRI|nr:hypothetical protein KP509_05G015000 [Ceratopteris richardii]
MAARRRASFTASSVTRLSSFSPEQKKGDIVYGDYSSQIYPQHRIPSDAAPATAASGASVSPSVSTAVSSVEKVTPNIITVLSSVLSRLITRNEQDFPVFSALDHKSSKGLSRFQGVRAPSISVTKYLERIHKYTNSGLSCFVVAYVYMDRLMHQQPDQPITSMNVHRLLITSMMIAAKVIEDVHFNNAFYAKVGGISVTELNKLEAILLFCLDFRVQVTSHVFESYCSHLERELHSIGFVPLQRSLPVFGDTQEPPSAEHLLEEGLEQN